MYATILSSLRVLLQLICGNVVAACILTWCRFVIHIPDNPPAEKTQILSCLVWGILSIYGTVTDGKMVGALVNECEPGLRITRVK